MLRQHSTNLISSLRFTSQHQSQPAVTHIQRHMVSTLLMVVGDAENVLLGEFVVVRFIDGRVAFQPGRDGEGAIKCVRVEFLRSQHDSGRSAVEFQDVTPVGGAVGVHLGVVGLTGRLGWEQFNQCGVWVDFCRASFAQHLKRK